MNWGIVTVGRKGTPPRSILSLVKFQCEPIYPTEQSIWNLSDLLSFVPSVELAANYILGIFSRLLFAKYPVLFGVSPHQQAGELSAHAPSHERTIDFVFAATAGSSCN